MNFLNKLLSLKTKSRNKEPGTLYFVCNICGSSCEKLASTLSRESPSCDNCGSTVRMRGMMHALSIALFKKSILITEFPHNLVLTGKGMSDWEVYADTLSSRLRYTNSYYHKEPKLDITKVMPEDYSSLDFLISTDVFEHVAPPVAIAFENTNKLLKSGGVFVFSVPYTLEPENVEHFPGLHNYKIENINGVRTLINQRKDGREECFQDLVFQIDLNVIFYTI
jgi:SAM-dependent methyltransferase